MASTCSALRDCCRFLFYCYSFSFIEHTHTHTARSFIAGVAVLHTRDCRPQSAREKLTKGKRQDLSV